MTYKFALPLWLEEEGLTQTAYSRWLHRKAAAHVKRDRLRSSHVIMGAQYRQLIHKAVCRSDGFDHYTGERLEWGKIGTYSNDESKLGRSIYKAGLALLPTVDHVLMENGRYDFVVCGWRTNDMKSDLSHSDFVDICRRVIAHQEIRGHCVIEVAILTAWYGVAVGRSKAGG